MHDRRLSTENYLVLTENRMKQRFQDTAQKVENLFQYERRPIIRRKVYMVYVRPTIEWFLPVIMTTNQNELAKSNSIEIFQQKMLAKILGVFGNAIFERHATVDSHKLVRGKLVSTSILIVQIICYENCVFKNSINCLIFDKLSVSSKRRSNQFDEKLN